MNGTKSWAWIVWTNTHPSKIMNKICPDINLVDADLCPDCRHRKCAKEKKCMGAEPRCDSDRVRYAGLSYEKYVRLECDMERERGTVDRRKVTAFWDYQDEVKKRVDAKLRKAYKKCKKYRLELMRIVRVGELD